MIDVVFFLGAIVMAAAPAPWVILIGRILVGLGVGMASMTAPLYIYEVSPAKIRGALVSINSFLVTGGQFFSYLINLAFTRATGTWRWMLGVAGVLALEDEAKQILSKIYPPNEVEEEIKLMRESIETEKAEEGSIGQNLGQKLKGALANEVIRRALYAGIIVQVTQQFVGINTIMYYSPTIVQFAGIALNSTALAVSLVTSEYVVMKAEAEVVEEMIKKRTVCLMDELFLECKMSGGRRERERVVEDEEHIGSA
ncbi:Inositol transporter [Arachis hypogaea]|nr:Inositol transporter [Arachis hypogaea]